MTSPDPSRPSAPASPSASQAPGSPSQGAERSGATATTRGRRRWPWILAGVLALLVVAVLLAPTLAAPIVAGRVVAAANERLHGTATLDGLSLSLGGHVLVSGLDVKDAQGRPVASVPSVEIQADVFALLGGRVVADVTVRGVQLHVRREADGRLNLQTLLRAPPPAAGQASLGGPVAAAAGRPEDGAPLAVADLPSIESRLRVTGATVVLHGEGDSAATELRELAFEARLEDLERPAPFSLTAVLAGPGGPAGRVRLAGDVTAARDGFVDPQRMSAHADYAFEDVRLDGLQPAAALFAPVQQLAGGLTGSGQWTWAGGLAVSGRTEFDLSGPALQLPALGPERRALPACRLVAEARLDAAGDGTQSVQFTAGTLLDLRYDGTVVGATGEAPVVDGTLAVKGRLEELQAAAADLAPLREGVELSGALALEARFGAALDAGKLATGTIDARLGVDDLSARETGGGKIHLGDLSGLDLVLRAEAAPGEGRLHLEHFELKAGPVSAHASARVSGLPIDEAAFDPARLVVQDGVLAADADLDRLIDSLSRVLDLGGLQLAGRLTARANADGRQGGAAADFDVQLDGLHVLAPAKPAVPAETAGAAATAATEIRVPSLSIRGRLAADERVARVLGLDVRWDSLTAAGLELPAAELGLTGSYAMEAGVLELEEWTLDSALAQGSGRARVSGLTAGAAGPMVSGSISVRGDAEPWRALLAGRTPALAAARARGAFALELIAAHEGAVSRIEPRLLLTGVALDGYVLDGKALPLPETDFELGAVIELDSSGDGRLLLPTLALKGPGITLDGKGEVLGLPGLGDRDAATSGAATSGAATTAAPELRARFGATWTADPAELGQRLAFLLGGPRPSGERLQGRLDLRLDGERYDVQGRVQGAAFVVDLPEDAEAGTPARRLVQRDLDLAFDVLADLGAADRVEIRTASFASGTARASVGGSLTGLSTPAEQAADLTLDLEASLAQVLADLGPLLPLPGWTAEGAATITGRLSGDAGKLALTSRTEVENLRVVVPPAPDAAEGSLPTVITDARLLIDAQAALDVEALDVELDHVDVRSSVLHGRLSGRALGLRALLAQPADGAAGGAAGGAASAASAAPAPAPASAPAPALAVARFAPLDGDFRYVPTRLGALLSPWLPGTLTGDAEEPLTFHVEGPVADFDPLALLGSLTTNATVGLGTLGLPPGLTTAGQVTVQSAAGRAQVQGGLSLNGGRLDLDALVDANPAGSASPPVSTLKLTLDAVQLNEELAGLLAYVHPLFASGKDAELATVTGMLGGALDVTWKGPLPTAGGETDWPTLLGRSLSATGRLSGDKLKLQGSPLLTDMLGRVGVGASKELSIAPVEFAVKDGRLAYAKPWTWSVSGIDTSFTGSLGLDLSLDLLWNVPVTDRMIEKYSYLKSLKGQAIAIPISGTVSAPELEWDGVLKDLAERAAKAELEQRAKEKLGGLGGILGGGSDDEGDGKPALSPEELLAAADKLWDAGQKAEAKLLYHEIIDKHKLTLVYALNKKRIKDRAED